VASRHLISRVNPVSIHPLAVVSSSAEIGSNVEIGPFSVIEPGVTIADGCCLKSHVVIGSGTSLGPENQVFQGAILGGLPQHMQMPECPGRLTIGRGNVFRENVTVHRSLYEGSQTTIGDECMLMVNTHVAHDCQVGSGTILTNNVMLGGHVEVGGKAFLSGGTAVHQFCRVGRLAMVGGMARVRQDVPPFVTVDGGSTMVVGLNRVGLKRAGFNPTELKQLKAAYRVIYRGGMVWNEMLLQLQQLFDSGPATEFEPFFRAGTRGFVQERRTPPGATVRLVREEETRESQAIALPMVSKIAG